MLLTNPTTTTTEPLGVSSPTVQAGDRANIIKPDFTKLCPRVKKRGRPRKAPAGVDNVIRPREFMVRNCELAGKFGLAARILIHRAFDDGKFETYAEYMGYYVYSRLASFSAKDLEKVKKDMREKY